MSMRGPQKYRETNACVYVWMTESPSLQEMMFGNDTFPHDSVAFSGAANQ